MLSRCDVISTFDMAQSSDDEDRNVTPCEARQLFEAQNTISLKGIRPHKYNSRTPAFYQSTHKRSFSSASQHVLYHESSNDDLSFYENTIVNRKTISERVIENGEAYNPWLTRNQSESKEESTNDNRSNKLVVPPEAFKQQRQDIKKWFSHFNDTQKNLILKDLLVLCDLPQKHLLSVHLEDNLHSDCPPNCKNWISWLPYQLALKIFSFLDPVSLCHVSQTCHSWYALSSHKSLWQSLSSYHTYSLSASRLEDIRSNHTSQDGDIQWKKVFAEQYRIRTNWLTGRCLIKSFEGHSGGISCVQFDDRRIVSGSWDTTIKVWNIKTNLAWSAQTLTGHSNTVRCLHLSKNRLVSGSTDCTIKVWDLASQPNWSSIACKVTMVGHVDAVRCLHVLEDKVISGSYDNTLKIWNLNTGTCLKTLRGHTDHVLCVQFDEDKIISGSTDTTIKMWNFNGTCTNTLRGHLDAVTCLQFDTVRIISGSLDCTIKFWSITTGECIRSIDWMASEGHTRVVRCIQADDNRLVSGSDDKTLKVWNLETGKRLITLRYHTDGVTCLQFSDTQIVSGSYDKKVLLWDFNV